MANLIYIYSVIYEKSNGLSVTCLRRAARILRLLAHPDRLKIIEWIGREGVLPVHALTERLRLPQAAVSGHLARLRALGLVRAERCGREVRYRIGDRRAIAVLNCVRRGSGKS